MQDFAAGIVLIEESGGLITPLADRNVAGARIVVSGDRPTHAEICALLADL
jgi:fructose-1,6-bisphosphatase/inositol monophosphatase family enzyme